MCWVACGGVLWCPRMVPPSITIDSACIDCRPGYGIADIERCTVVGDDSIPHIDAALEYTSNWCARSHVDPLASELLVGLVGSEVDCPRQVLVRHAGRQHSREQVNDLHSTGGIHSSSIVPHKCSKIELRIGNYATSARVNTYREATTDVI
jgi:hypothetical protein